jgi:ribosomal protein L30/L7E
VPEPIPAEHDAIAYIRSPAAIRERCQQVLELARADRLHHFVYHADKLPEVAGYVAQVTRDAYPHLDVPFHSRWRHFDVGGIDRVAYLDAALGACSAAERARCRFDLVITSVLLDAGAGEHWQYHEAQSGETYARSEGLAVASFHAFLSGLFSSRADYPWQVDARGLQRLTEAALADALQVTAANPLLGLAGRAALLRALGTAAQGAPQYFGTDCPRLGHLFDYLWAHTQGGVLPARQILLAVLESFSPIWPGRLCVGGVNLGDVWRHSQIPGAGLTAGLVPLHKLSQWLTYSLIETIIAAGVTVTGLDALTGLAEYRNGGLLLDLGLLTPKHDAVLTQVHPPEAEIIVEWRALTVALLDRVAEQVRALLGLSAQAFPLVKVLEGGTWRAGRRIAREKRTDGSPPLRIVSDGTVF